MSTFTPITITHENISWALNENIRMLIECLQDKMPIAAPVQMRAGIDANGLQIKEASSPTTPRSAVTVAKLNELT